MREYSTPTLVEIPGSANLTDIVFKRAADAPGMVVLRRKAGGGWRDVTAGEFHRDVVATAKGLVAAGIEPGDRVGLMSRTRYEWTQIDYAILAAGAVCVPIYETSSAEQVAWILSDSGAKGVFVETPAHAVTVADVRDKVADLGQVWQIDAGALGELAAAGTEISDEQIAKRRGSRGAADIATIIYTSGTTGRPRGCELTNGNLLSDARNAFEGALAEAFNVAGGSTLLFLPLAHSFARIIQVGCVESATILGHAPDMANVQPDLASYRPTFILAVPRVFEKVYNSAMAQAADSPAKKRIFGFAADTAVAYSKALDSGGPGLPLRLQHGLADRLVYGKIRAAVGGQVRYSVSGGAALGERLGHFFRGAGITILEGYGLTETSPAATVNRPSRNKIGTVGLPLPGVAVRIADDGEILIRGAIIFAGYWRNKAATAEVIDDSGWFHTGDIGELDDQGFLRITGRKKELIVTAAGKNLAPALLEDRIRAHPLISQCIVVGDGRPYIGCLVTLDEEALQRWKEKHGKAIATVASLRDDAELVAEIQAAIDDANNAVSRAESIRRFRVLGTDFTEAGGHLTPKLSLRRYLVTKDFATEIDALYA
ncbi:MAG TPA: AMP-dependent synthetase/ligase [Streptosporangiaceae bacterium]|nr:AMP-dependent synthetase/ligase [Streptosporangiaceae bacterium]